MTNQTTSTSPTSGRVVTIPYVPQRYQRELHEDSHRYKVVNIGRRGGKTEFVLNELLVSAIADPGLYWYVAPSYRQAKSISWVRLKVLLKDAYDLWKFNEQELYAEHISTGARIELKGADNEDSLLGVGLKGVVFDETARIRESVWTQIVRPMLADSKGWAIFISTPKGKNWFYDIFMKGAKGDPEWRSWKYPTSVNEYIDQAEIDQMKKDMPAVLFKQEVLAEFIDDSVGVFRGLTTCICGDLKDPVAGRFYVAGIDLAKYLDFTVITIVDSITREVVYQERFNDISWSEQKVRITQAVKRYNNAMCLIDATGVGDPIVEDLQNSGLSIHYEDGKPGYKFTNQSKCRLIDQLSIAIEQRQITFPPELVTMIEELRVFEYVISEGGVIKYQAPEGKHDDCVISLALAVWGIRNQLHEAQILREDDVILSAQDRQGLGDRVSYEEEQDNYAGY